MIKQPHLEEGGKDLPVPAPGRPETGGGEPGRDSQLISFGDKVTYVFARGKEIASIHFDLRRGEIFYKGHNIRNIDLEEWQEQALDQLRRLLADDEKGKMFAAPYGRVLDKIIIEKRHAKEV